MQVHLFLSTFTKLKGQSKKYKLMRGRMKRYLALDIGDVRIGVARSDLMGIIATPLETHK